MNELKPCPHGKSVSVRIQHKQVGFLGQNGFGTKKIRYQSYAMCNKCFAKGPPSTTVYLTDAVEGRESLRMNDEKAVAVWNRRAQPANAPLPMEELWGMEGEWVWVEHMESSASLSAPGEWLKLKTCKPTRLDPYISFESNGLCALYYGKSWLAYRHKPEGDA